MSDATLKRSAQIVALSAILGGSTIGWGMSTGWVHLDAAMHKAWRQPDAFASGGLGGVLSPFTVGFFFFFLVLWVVVLISSRSEVGQAAYAVWSPPSRNPTISALAKGMAWTTGGALIVALVFCSFDALTSYCLTPAGIDIHPTIISREYTYKWNQVRRVKTICWLGRKPIRFVYKTSLVMDDGYNLQLPESELSPSATSSEVRYFDNMKKALFGLPFTFDNSSVEPACSQLGVLAARP